MWLVIVDGHWKWSEVLPFRSTTAQGTVASLRTVFARYGCPEELASDNGPQFVAAEFEAVLRANGIRHRTSAPYHPATNGLAERFVQFFKRAMKAFPDAMPCQEAADKFLISYRNTVHPCHDGCRDSIPAIHICKPSHHITTCTGVAIWLYLIFLLVFHLHT
eukprot:scpid23237/ scgid5336/ Uncharacterized protein K02A2.6